MATEREELLAGIEDNKKFIRAAFRADPATGGKLLKQLTEMGQSTDRSQFMTILGQVGDGELRMIAWMAWGVAVEAMIAAEQKTT